MLYLHLVSLESDLFVSEVTIYTQTRGTAPSTPPEPDHSLDGFAAYSSYLDLQQSRLGLCGVLYFHGWAPCFTILCMYPTDIFFRMANQIGYLSDGRYGEDTDAELYGNGFVDYSFPKTEKRDLGDDEEKDSSILESSSDPFPVLPVPSVGPGVRHTAGSVPSVQTGTHTDTSISNMHVYVGQIVTAGANNNADWEEIPLLRCSVHSTSWQSGCAVCDRTLSLLSKATADDPNSLAVSDRLLGRVGTRPTYAVELGLVGLEVARHVSHQSEPLTTKQASQLSQTNLMVLPAQEFKLNNDLQAEAFLQDFEKSRSFQQQLVYKGKLIGLLEGIRVSMTPLFALTNELRSFEAKLKLFCGELGITFAQLDRNSGFKKGIGGRNPLPIIIRPIVAGPNISVPLVNPADMLGGLGLTPEMHDRVKKRVNLVHQANSGTVDAGLSRLQDSFRHVYDLSTKLAFATSEHLNLFFRLSGFHDDALGRLVRLKLLQLSEPKVRRTVVKGARQNEVGLPDRDETVFHESV